MSAIVVQDMTEEATAREQAQAFLDVAVVEASHAMALCKAVKGAGVILQLAIGRELHRSMVRIQGLVDEAEDCDKDYTQRSAVALALRLEVRAVRDLARRMTR